MPSESEELEAELREFLAFQLEAQEKALALLDALRDDDGADEGFLERLAEGARLRGDALEPGDVRDALERRRDLLREMLAEADAGDEPEPHEAHGDEEPEPDEPEGDAEPST